MTGKKGNWQGDKSLVFFPWFRPNKKTPFMYKFRTAQGKISAGPSQILMLPLLKLILLMKKFDMHYADMDT